MKLKSAHVTNFRSILDSGPVEIEATTCLVGKNEAGKTAFLKALEGLKPVNKSYAYDKTRDYPRRDLSKYDRIHEGGDATIISTVWELEKDDIEALTEEFGEAAVSGTEITLERGYGDAGKNWTVPIDESAVLGRLKRPGFTGGFFIQNLCNVIKGVHACIECVLHFLRRLMADCAM